MKTKLFLGAGHGEAVSLHRGACSRFGSDRLTETAERRHGIRGTAASRIQTAYLYSPHRKHAEAQCYMSTREELHTLLQHHLPCCFRHRAEAVQPKIPFESGANFLRPPVGHSLRRKSGGAGVAIKTRASTSFCVLACKHYGTGLNGASAAQLLSFAAAAFCASSARIPVRVGFLRARRQDRRRGPNIWAIDKGSRHGS